MGGSTRIIIPFSGLSLGNHHFDFQIEDSFFEPIPYSEISGGDVKVGIELDRQERMMVLTISLEGSVKTLCDRCLDPFDLQVTGQEVIYVKFGDEYEEESPEVLVIPRTEHKIDLTHILYEILLLMLPFQRIHPENKDGQSACDPDVISRLKSMQPQSPHDPRWDALNTLNKEE